MRLREALKREIGDIEEEDDQEECKEEENLYYSENIAQ
jgi:hypothetical protein